jgi:hypothetical protein
MIGLFLAVFPTLVFEIMLYSPFSFPVYHFAISPVTVGGKVVINIGL